ncbi:hypothetical protein [Olleya marilimosa]|uniref:DUF3828 domain-containing protein n=1 Tax=Olleya marilimosa TaxID=272164 RepID=A0ABR8LTH2_9FLAO|nr:hypothetical protein [Olleya marilimosa]MBD3863473.1 hypothetical protein [Olleya marilimosa]MBD3891230.1 hypothetical protein [Olleya marilimosa]
MKLKYFIISVFFINISYSQSNKSKDWTNDETAYYNTFENLARYTYKKDIDSISKDTLIEKYIYFDYVLKDTVQERKQKRIKKLIPLFSYFKKTLDSLGIDNIDAKPIRFYKNHKIYEPFDEDKTQLKTVGGKKMYTEDVNVFAYFRKEEPENPLGTLLFEPKTHKLLSWVLINQGGYRYFLLFNIL